jgi:hypothetical protein
MSWWQKLFGGSRQAKTPPAGSFPVTIPLVEGLSATVHLHDLPNGPEQIPCWTYVTSGLWDHGQKEIIFSLRRRPGEPPADFPQDPLGFFVEVHRLAREGRLVDVGGHTCFRNPAGFLGGTEQIGFAYISPEPLAGVDLPPQDRAMTAILLAPAEAEVVPVIGSYRVTTLLGQATRYYPCPPWAERGRRPLLSRQDLEQSLLGKMQTVYCPGAAVRMLMEPQQPTAPGQDRITSSQGKRITLRLPARHRPGLGEYLAGQPDQWGLALLTEPDPEANVRLVWRPGQQHAQTITPYWSDGSCFTGGFLALVAEASLSDGACVFEDGFLVTLSPATQGRVREALTAGKPLVVGPANPDLTEFSLEWVPDTTAPAPAGPGSAPPAGRWEPFAITPSGPAFDVNQNVLYQPDPVLRQRVASIEVFAKYLKQIMDTAAEYWAGVPAGESRAVTLVVAVKPGGRSRFWLDANPPGLEAELVRGLYERLQGLPVPLVRQGPVAVAIQATLWGCGGRPGGWAFIPREWQDACGGQELLVPDGILEIVWPD